MISYDHNLKAILVAFWGMIITSESVLMASDSVIIVYFNSNNLFPGLF